MHLCTLNLFILIEAQSLAPLQRRNFRQPNLPVRIFTSVRERAGNVLRLLHTHEKQCNLIKTTQLKRFHDFEQLIYPIQLSLIITHNPTWSSLCINNRYRLEGQHRFPAI